MIDCTKLDMEDALRRLRDILKNECSAGGNVDILAKNPADAKKIKAFAEMSGCGVEIAKQDNGSYLLHLKGGGCRC